MVKGPQPVTEADWKLFDRGQWPPKTKPATKPVKPKPKPRPQPPPVLPDAAEASVAVAEKPRRPRKRASTAAIAPQIEPAAEPRTAPPADIDEIDEIDNLDGLDEPVEPVETIETAGVAKSSGGIKGCEQPRIYTKERRELTEDTSDGWAAIAFAEDMLGMALFPWQKWLLIHALELNEDYTYRFRTVIMSQSRQNGKTFLMVILALWHLYCKGSRTIIATAQDLSKAEDAWNLAVEFAQSDEELNELIRKISLAHPKLLKVLNPLTGKLCEYRVASKSRGGGRGYSGDLVLLDELREHQTWDSWAAISKTQMARPRAQAWAFTNAGDSLSVVWRYQRAAAHQKLGWPDGDQDAPVLGEVDPNIGELLADLEKEFGSDMQVGWFEWSAPPTAKRTDRQAWASANGSMNHTEVVEDCVTERAIAHALYTDPVAVFDQEVMCRFVPFADGGPFPAGSWRDTCDENGEAVPAEKARSVMCLEVSVTRSAAVIAKATLDDNGNPIVGISEMLAGTDWVLDWLLERRSTFAGIVVRSGAGSPVLALLQGLQEADPRRPLPIIEWKTMEVGAAFGQLFDKVRDRTIRHLPHTGLDSAACSATPKLQSGGGWIVDPLKSPSDTAPLYAVTGAVWGLSQLPDTGPSIYSDAGGGSSVFAF